VQVQVRNLKSCLLLVLTVQCVCTAVCVQVRNLRSCLKVAADFVSPEAMPHCMAMAGRLRQCFKAEQVRATASMFGWVWACMCCLSRRSTAHMSANVRVRVHAHIYHATICDP